MKHISLLRRAAGFLLALGLACTTRAGDGGYLFVTFRGEQSPMTEQVYFALSKDGRNWNALNGGEPVLVSGIGEKGVRDPFLIRSHDGKGFYMIATDLSIHLNRDWGRAQTAASKSIVVWESPDLVRWSEPRLVRVAPDEAGCTWAPEVIYNEETRDYLVFWASKTRDDDFKKHRIWAARTRDFRTFGKPFVYIDKPAGMIDTNIVHENGRYYRFTKNEDSKAILMETSETLKGPWKDVEGFSLASLRGYEGPECYQLKPATGGKPAVWCLVLDHYARGAGYQPYITDDLSSGRFTPGPDFSFPFHFRHGSILPVSTGEYEDLEKAYARPAAD